MDREHPQLSLSVRILQALFIASPCFCGIVAGFWLTGGARDLLQEHLEQSVLPGTR